MPSSAPPAPPAARRSAALCSSHARVCSSAERTVAVPNTCGWRRSSLSLIAAATASRSNSPCSSAMRAWNTTWNSRSPSSSRTCSASPCSIASASSKASSSVCGAIVDQVCSRSHGQPRSGSRNATMIARSRSMDTSVLPQHPPQRDQHAGGRAPDVALAERNVVRQELVAAEGARSRGTWCAGSSTNSSGTSNTSSTSVRSSCSANPGRTNATAGVIR